MKEQIKEIARALCEKYDTEHCKVCDHNGRCMVRLEAERIYEAGYRKQSVGEWKKVEEDLGGGVKTYRFACTREITEACHVTNKTIAKVKAEMGGAKICPSCKRESTANARFCWYCGKDIRNERDLLIDKVIALRGLIVHLPENLQAKYDADTKAVLDYLNRKEK